MELNLGNVGQIIVIVTFSSGVVKYLIIKPLQTSIDSLNKAIGKMQNTLDRLEDDMKNIDKRLAVNESSTKSAHKRISEGGKH